MGRSINKSPFGPNGGHFISAQAEKGSKSNGLKPPRRVIVDEDKDGVALITSPSPGRAPVQARIVVGFRQKAGKAMEPKPTSTASPQVPEVPEEAGERVFELTKKKSKPSSPDSGEAILLSRPKEQPKEPAKDDPITGEQKPEAIEAKWQAPQQTPAGDETPEAEEEEVVPTPPPKAPVEAPPEAAPTPEAPAGEEIPFVSSEEVGEAEVKLLDKMEEKLLDKISETIGERGNATITVYRLLEDDSLLAEIKVAKNGEDTSEVTLYLVLQKKDGDFLIFGGKHAKEVDDETRENAFKTINSAKQFEQESRKVETEIGDASDFEIDVQPSEIDEAKLDKIEIYQQMCNAIEKAANERGQEDRAAKARDLRASLTNLSEDQLLIDAKTLNRIYEQIRELFANTESTSSPDVEITVQLPQIDEAILNKIELYQQKCDAAEKAANNKKGQEFRAARACNLKESLTKLLGDKSMDPEAKEQKINKIFEQIHELLTEDEVVLVEETEDLDDA